MDDRDADQPAEGTRACPKCGREGPDWATLCPRCGETLYAQGYCAICEAYLPAPVGTPCPKHEVELEARHAGPRHTIEPGSDVEWVTVGSFTESIEAEAPRLRLEAEEIPTFLEGERMGRNSMYAVATGGVKLQVPRPFVDEARVLLAQSWTPPATEDDLDDAWDDLAPDPGSVRLRIMKGVLIFMLTWPLAVFLLGLLWYLLRSLRA